VPRLAAERPATGRLADLDDGAAVAGLGLRAPGQDVADALLAQGPPLLLERSDQVIGARLGGIPSRGHLRHRVRRRGGDSGRTE
jgi:hypothetical protein